IIAGVRAGAEFSVSSPVGLAPEVRRLLTDADIPVWVETDVEWITRMAQRHQGGEVEASRPPRARLIGAPESVAALHRALAEAVGGDPDLAIYDNEVTTAGRIELLPFLHEQAITITAHRFGNPDPWSESVI